MPLDLMGFMLPFLLVLAIIYGALDLASVFKNRAVNAIIAVVVAVIAVSNAGVVAFIVQVMPWAALLFIVVFFIKFVLSMFRPGEGGRDYTLLIALLGLLAVFMLSQGTELVHDWLPGGFPVSEDNLILIIGLIIVVALIFAAYKSSSGATENQIR